jgi:hypothetical protein
MGFPWLKQIIGEEKRTHRRWVSGHITKGEKRKHEASIAESIATFKQEMDRKGVGFREDRDAWEAYWEKYPRAHMELVGASVDDVLGEKAYQVFQGFWRRINKPVTVRFEGNGIMASAPTLLTIGTGDNRIRGNPLDALGSTDPEERARMVVSLDQTIGRKVKRHETDAKEIEYLLMVRKAYQDGDTLIPDPLGGYIVQGLLGEPTEEEEDVN